MARLSHSKNQKVRIGTRGSPLALWQANWVSSQLRQIHPTIEIELIIIKTSGDQIKDQKLLEQYGYKGLFIKEIEEALLEKRIDIAVHSMKDMPGQIPLELTIAAIPARVNPSDVLIALKPLPFQTLPSKTVMGTSSIRRKCQLKKIRSDLIYKDIRGNVDTRLKKLKEGQCGALILARAGIERLGLHPEFMEDLPLIPAVGQGALSLETRTDDQLAQNLVAPLADPLTSDCVHAERAYLKVMGGGCQVPLACYVKPLGTEEVTIRAFVSNEDGTQFIQREATVQRSLATQTTKRMAYDILADGGRKILDQLMITDAKGVGSR